jgi:prepilin-type N-terminal cleavage/methylation domain-containing protein
MSLNGHRSGFTLVELLMTLSLALLIAGTAATLLARHLRFHRDLLGMLAVRRHVDDAAAILSADLRGASVTDSIRFTADTAIELFTISGASVVCTLPSAVTATLPPDTLASGNILTAFSATPDSADEITVFHDSSALSTTRGWTRHAIISVSRTHTAVGCPPSSTFTDPADVAANRKAYTLTLASPIPPTVRPGAPLRVLRRARYSVYRASDGKWYLGYRRCPSGVCNPIQPVSGPYASRTTRPLTFRYYSADGTEIAPTLTIPIATIARVDVAARAHTNTQVRLPGMIDTLFADSSITTIAFRNAR